MKKRVLLIVFAVIVAAVAAIAVACSDDTTVVPNAIYSVTADYDSDLGTVEITDNDGEVQTHFKSGSTVTVTVTPEFGYAVTTFNVNGSDKALENGVYSFKITKDTTVTVEFDVATYTVTADYNSDRGDVEVKDEDGNAKTTFTHGDTVVVTAAAKAGSELALFKVNGEVKHPESGEYSFEITEETKIKAVFGLGAITQAILDTSKANLTASGTCEYTEGGKNPTTNTITAVFGTDTIFYEERLQSGEVDFSMVYANKDGKLAQVVHTVDNTINYNISSHNFADYYNPFALLTPEDFEPTEKADVFAVIDSDKAKAAAMALTGWTEKIGVFEAKVEDGKITEVHIETAEGAQSSGVAYHSDYVFTLTEHGTAALASDLVNPFEHENAHDELRAALLAMAESHNYTVEVLDIMTGDDDVNYHVFVTETATYEDCVGFECGYVFSEGKVYPYNRYPNKETEKIVLSDPLNNVTSILTIRASFIGYAPELFSVESDENGTVFTLRDNNLADDIFIAFGDGLDKMKYYSFAVSGSITLDPDGNLAAVNFDYEMYGYTGSITLLYSDVDSTVIPDYVDFDDVVKTSMFDPFAGTYTDGEHTVVINAEDGITIDGVIATVKSYSRDDGMFTVDLDGQELYVGKKSSRQLIVFSDDYFIFYELLFVGDVKVEIPEEIQGKWLGTYYGESVLEATNIAYDTATDTISFKLGVLDCELSGEKAATVDVFTMIVDGDPLDFTRDNKYNADWSEYEGEIIPTKYFGSFTAYEIEDGERVDYILYILGDEMELSMILPYDSKAVITDSSVKIDGIELEYLSYSKEEGMVMMYKGITYNFVIMKNGFGILLYDGVDVLNDFYIFDTVDDTPDVPDVFIGKFSGYSSLTGNGYILTCTVDSVKLAIGNGSNVPATEGTIISVEKVVNYGARVYEMTIEVDGITYTVTEGSEKDIISLKNADISVPLDRIGGGEDGVVPEKFYGNYLVLDGEKIQDMVCIDEDGVTIISIGDDYFYEGDEITIVSADTVEIKLVAGDETYYISVVDTNEAGQAATIMLVSEDYSVMITLNRYVQEA